MLEDLPEPVAGCIYACNAKDLESTISCPSRTNGFANFSVGDIREEAVGGEELCHLAIAAIRRVPVCHQEVNTALAATNTNNAAIANTELVHGNCRTLGEPARTFPLRTCRFLTLRAVRFPGWWTRARQKGDK